MHARVLRIGQLSGDKANAIWNDTEAVALMIRSALTVGALPALDERPSWLPVDSCAKAIADLSISTSETSNTDAEDADLVYHLVNPCTFDWKTQLLPTLQQRSALPAFDVVSPQEWLQRLESSEQDPAKNPSIKLIDFWKAKYGYASSTSTSTADDEPVGLTFETARTVKDCPSLGEEHDPVTEGLIERYVDIWLRSWKAN
jgi:thioester reductase-like protein